jgi:hypothetical protein
MFLTSPKNKEIIRVRINLDHKPLHASILLKDFRKILIRKIKIFHLILDSRLILYELNQKISTNL